MKYSCLHTHTEFCDGKGSVEDYCKTAFEKGFISLGFSAHAPVTKKTGMPSSWHISENKLNDYCNAVAVAQKKWKDKLSVYLGLEADYIKNYISPSDADFKELNLDYIIGSVHCVLPSGCKIDWADTKNILCVDGSQSELEFMIQNGWNGSGSNLALSYWDAVVEMCKTGGFDILGHADLIKKNNSLNKYFFAKDYMPKIEELAEVLSQTNIIVEVNTGGLNRGKTTETYPSVDILKIFKQKNIPVTINADAHSVQELGGHYDDAQRVLLESGYKSFMLFNKHKWEPVEL
jgi:histidinol-phosphatase (PHP family)